jgi:hypothetical protein
LRAHALPVAGWAAQPTSRTSGAPASAGEGVCYSTRQGVRKQFMLRSTGVVPVSTDVKVTALSRDFGSQRRLAELLGVNAAQITRWRRGEGIDDVNAGRVDLLELVMAHLLRLVFRAPS